MSKSKRKKYAVRVDRLIILVIILVGIPILISLMFKGCAKDTTPSDDTVIFQKDVKVSSSFSSFESAIDRLGFEKRSYSVDDIHYGELILVNSEHEYVFDESRLADNVEVESAKNEYYTTLSSSILLNSTAIENFNALMQDFYIQYADDSIYMVNGYRSKLEQDIVYQQAVDNNISENPAGCSDFHTGYSFDLAVLPNDTAIQDFSTYSNASWIVENCANYGFIQRYPEDKQSITGLSVPNQFRYVSVPHSLYMKENNLCLEEYISLLEGYQFGNKALRFTYNEQEYMVYVCTVSENSDTVDVYVPKDKNYTVCGNNVDGFIVTVEV